MRNHARSLLPSGRRPKVIVIIVVLLAAVTATLITLVEVHKPTPAVTYTNLSRNFRVCLLTTTNGAAENAPVWTAIQTATTQAPINAQHITAPTGTPDQLAPYLNSLIAMKCGLIVTAGNDLADTTTNTARSNPTQRFLTSTNSAGLPNVDTIPAAPEAITAEIVNAAHGHYPTTK